jgi:hypothetical protein
VTTLFKGGSAGFSVSFKILKKENPAGGWGAAAIIPFRNEILVTEAIGYQVAKPGPAEGLEVIPLIFDQVGADGGPDLGSGTQNDHRNLPIQLPNRLQEGAGIGPIIAQAGDDQTEIAGAQGLKGFPRFASGHDPVARFR